MPKFTSEEAVEIELLLWEYDRDGSIAIDNFIHREPELRGQRRPQESQRAYLSYLNRRKGWRRPGLSTKPDESLGAI
jgi:hypothetical protein